MPKIIRWFKVTHDINQDPEMWELRLKFGDRAGFVWLECLSIAGRNEGLVGPNTDQLHAVLASKCRVYSPKVRAIFVWLLGKGWLVDRNGLRVAKWSKYNVSRKSLESPTRLDETRQDKKRQDKSAEAPFILPDWIPQKEWEEFKAVRKRKRAPLTDQIAIRIIAVLERLRGAGHEPAAVLAQAVNRNWTSIEFDWVHKVGVISQAEGELSERTKRILRRGL